MPWFMLRVQEELRALFTDEEGQDLIEYGMVVTLIALAAITSMQSLGDAVVSLFHNAATSVA